MKIIKECFNPILKIEDFLIKSIFILSFIISVAHANHVKWQGNYNKALQQARQENKILMVLLIQNNCQKCKDVVKNIFSNKAYINELNKHIVAVIVNINNKHSFPIEMYWSNEYPTLFFVDSLNEVFIHKPLTNIMEKDIKNVLKGISK